MELTGRIIAVLPAQSGVSARTGNSWMTQQYVLEVPGQYPKKCVFSVFGEDRIRQFNLGPNEDVTVHFDIDAREYNGKWYNEIRAYNVVRSQQTASAPNTNATATGQNPAGQPTLFPPAGQPAPENNDDLPF